LYFSICCQDKTVTCFARLCKQKRAVGFLPLLQPQPCRKYNYDKPPPLPLIALQRTAELRKIFPILSPCICKSPSHSPENRLFVILIMSHNKCYVKLRVGKKRGLFICILLKQKKLRLINTLLVNNFLITFLFLLIKSLRFVSEALFLCFV
jgi:hypothetical protein